MKLAEEEAIKFEEFLMEKEFDFTHLAELQKILPKTTIELIMSVIFRGVAFDQVELIAEYLKELPLRYQFENVRAFDPKLPSL